MLDHELLQSTLEEWQLPLDAAQVMLFDQYLTLLNQWNERMNLVAQSTLADATRRHILDSLVLATVLEKQPASIADIGSGAGLPGIPLAILWRDANVLLVESIGKKTNFLQHVVTTLGLAHVTVCNERAEVVGRDRKHREAYELVTARAVSQMATLAEYCLPLCTVDGIWLAPKGNDIEAELAHAENAISLLGGNLESVYDVSVPDEPIRSLIVVRKVQRTPMQYPRTVGLPAKQPL